MLTQNCSTGVEARAFPVGDVHRHALVGGTNACACGEGGRHPSRSANLGGSRRTECRIGTWNVRGGMKDKMNEMIDVMKERRLDALCLTETKRKGCDADDLPGGVVALWSGVDQDEHASGGVGVVLSSRFASGVKDYSMVGPRLLWVRIKLGITRVFLVAAYAPISSAGPQELEKFWESVKETLDLAEGNERIIMCGDLNGWVGTKRAGLEAVLGPHGDKRANDAGKPILDVCLEWNLLVSNTLFRHKDIHTYTWGRNDQKSVIDMMLIDSRLRNTIMDTRAYRGPTLGTDHYLVISRFVGLFKKWRHWRVRDHFGELERIKCERLEDVSVRSMYADLVSKRLADARLSDLGVDECWEIMRDGIVESAKEACGSAKRHKSLKGEAWWDADVKSCVERKKKAWLDYVSVLQSNDSMRELKKDYYRRCKNETRALVKEKRERMILNEEERLTKDFEANNKLFWRKVRKSRGFSSASRMDKIKSKAGDILANPTEVLGRWSEYFGEMYEYVPDAGAASESMTDFAAPASDEDISEEEIEWSIRSLKNGKAAGIDKVSAEMIKLGGPFVRDAFLTLSNLCWRTGRVPMDWRRAVIVPLYKGKGSRMQCASYRAISLISIAAKVYTKIIERRMRVKSEGLLWEAQGGFRNGRGCMDQVFSLRNIVEKRLAVGQKVFCGFVDLEKAFDRVIRKDLWGILPGYGVSGTLLRAVQSTYVDCTACVRIDGGLSPWFGVNIGVRQGCVLSARLFILYLDSCLQRMKAANVGLRMGDLVVSCLLYADDAVLLAESPSQLQTLVTMMKDDCKLRGLQLNAKKTKVMVFEREETRASVRITVDDVVLEQVDEIVYLGCAFSRDGRYTADIERRATFGNSVNGALGKFLSSKTVSKRAQLAIHNAVLVPTLTYGSESWVWKSAHESRINAVEMRALRKICGVTLADRVENKAIRQRAGVKESVGVKVRKGMLRWFGHVERMEEERLTKQIYSAKVEGCRGRGRPRHTFQDQIDRVLSEGDVRSHKNRRACMKRVMSVREASEICKNRTLWRSILSAYPARDMA